MTDSLIHELAQENIPLCCSLIEKAVVDKSLKDIEEHMLRSKIPHPQNDFLAPFSERKSP